MSILEKIFSCCEREKSLKKSDIDINTVKCENENNIPCTNCSHNTEINRNSAKNNCPVVNVAFSSNKNIIKINLLQNDDLDKNSCLFMKNIQGTIKIQENNINKIYFKKKFYRPTQTEVGKRNDEKNNIISISEISFTSGINEQKDSFSKLLLTGDLFFNKELIITENGLVNSKRNKKDGYTVFGLKNSVDIYGNLTSDFIINFQNYKEEEGYKDINAGKVFEIKFNKDKKEYTLYFINPFLYLYYKINNFVYFYPGRDYFLFVGKIFLSINIEKKADGQVINIQVDNTCKELENPDENNRKYSFGETKAIIKIGRVNCDINISEKCISKIHGIIEFSKINQKFYYKDMSSTNGTTLLVKKGDFLKIKGEMNFKLEDVSFKIQEIP